MEMDPKHKSKLHKGFDKMAARQDAKPQISVRDTGLLSIDENGDSLEMLPLMQKFYNNKWNGMNLKCLRNRFAQTMPGWFNSRVSINKDGKYFLNTRGKQHLRRKKINLLSKT